MLRALARGLVTLLTLGTLTASTLAADLPPDLAAVPPDAMGFVHLRVGDIYRSDQSKDLRAFIAMAGPDALRAFSERFVPDLTTLDRITVYIVMPEGTGRPVPVMLLRMSQPFDRAKIGKSMPPGAIRTQVGDAVYFLDRPGDLAVRALDDRIMQFCPASMVNAVARQSLSATGPLSAALAAAAANKAVVVAVNPKGIPPELFAKIPAAAVPIAKLQLATVSVDWAPAPRIDIRLAYPDGESAADAEQMLRALVEVGRSALVGARAELQKTLEGQGKANTIVELPEATAALVGIGSIHQYEDMLKAIPLKRNGGELSLIIDVPAGNQSVVAMAAVGAGLLLPAVQKVREAAARMSSQNNLKQIGLAMHNFHDVTGAMPAQAIYSKDGKKPLLSWRVAILPYIEQEALYGQFRLDEPWDSEHNKKLIAIMPRIYAAPDLPPTPEPGMTYYQVFVGGGAAWEKKPLGLRLTEFPDGTSNTILVAEAGDSVIWTKPDDLNYDPKKPLPRLANVLNRLGFNVLMGDGSVRFIGPKVKEATLRGAITASGGEVLGDDWNQ